MAPNMNIQDKSCQLYNYVNTRLNLILHVNIIKLHVDRNFNKSHVNIYKSCVNIINL